MSAAQIIDKDKVFHARELEHVLRDCPSEKVHIVAILGPQSSGKSTLLNGLFKTSFQVMDEAKRRQTTQGIWASRGDGSDTLVLDVEGTDGRERGDDQDFERKSALFSLAVAKVLIVNIWENSVGLYHAANMSLLRTVMDVHLQLSDPTRTSKTVLLFVVRDYAGKTPTSNLSNVLSEDLRQIWDSVKKPDAAINLRLEDAFELRFAFLPHKILQPMEFESEVGRLCAKFTDARLEDYILSRRPEDVHIASDLPVFAGNIWKTIEANKDLDLPTERELLAQYRCDEIANSVYADLLQGLDAPRAAIASGKTADGLGGLVTELLRTATAEYESDTARYSPGVVSRKLGELTERMLIVVEELLSKQMENAQKHALRAFLQTMEQRGSDTTFANALNAAYCLGEQRFQDILRGNSRALFDLFADTCPPVLAGKIESYEMNFAEVLREKSETLRMEEANVLLQKCQRKTERSLQLLHDPAFGMGNEEAFWPSFWDLLNSVAAEAQGDLDYIRSDIGLSEKRYQKLLADVSNWLSEEISLLLRDELSDQKICDRIMAYFEGIFAYDESHLPRIWRDEAEVDAIFKSSRDATLGTLQEIQSSGIPGWVADSILSKGFEGGRLTLLDDAASQNIQKSIERQIERRYVEAKRNAVSSQTHIPSWVYLLLLVLGWNEIMTILKSPLYLLLFIVLCGAFAAYRIFNLQPYLWVGIKYAMNVANQKLPATKQMRKQNFREKSD